MSFVVDIDKKDFFNELDKELQKKYFGLKVKKYLPSIDNIYYTVFIAGDTNENEAIKPFIQKLEFLKQELISTHVEPDYSYGLQVVAQSYKLYKYCLSNRDLYDIFILSYLPNVETPRIAVQIRAYGLWMYGAEKMLIDSYNHVNQVLSDYGCTISMCRENRIDYCYHTNCLVNPNKVLKVERVEKQLNTTMKKWGVVGDIEKENGVLTLQKDYMSFGERSSNNVFVRIYNKCKEVVEKGYKGFFFELWEQNGLINKYDKYCLEYALQYKNFDYVHKAKLMFYIEHGADQRVRRDFELALEDKNLTFDKCKELAKPYMPEVTTIMNIEYQTQRRFYYFSDKYIEVFSFKPRDGLPPHLNRLFRIIDNRDVFLDYLTSKTVSFMQSEDKYTWWWERLRNTKLDCIGVDEKLMRDYAINLDKRLAKVRFINSVCTVAVYNNRFNTGFISDISDALSNLNDNFAHDMQISVYNNDGEIIEDLNIDMLKYYNETKERKEKQLKNRKKKITQTLNTAETLSQNPS